MFLDLGRNAISPPGSAQKNSDSFKEGWQWRSQSPAHFYAHRIRGTTQAQSSTLHRRYDYYYYYYDYRVLSDSQSKTKLCTLESFLVGSVFRCRKKKERETDNLKNTTVSSSEVNVVLILASQIIHQKTLTDMYGI
ncbi:hypothetical protein OUZ56_015845 [Daphnia magna]|uniref:Uncharacterized protein n=1 Tax=Daphnia magna TaxID=35525 RepID=A0ABR0ANX4_9CRUS|nr:hypothetical protein OUZ56_015845 [Daphnia magna]